MSTFKKLTSSIFNALEMAGRAKTLAHLEGLSDRTLQDLGFSRTLMSQGVQAWPWKADQEITAQAAYTESGEIDAAITELEAYNDRDLADLGISRNNIREAVIHGRKGIDTAQAA